VRHSLPVALNETRTGPDRPVAFAHANAILATLIAACCLPRLASRAFMVIDVRVLRAIPATLRQVWIRLYEASSGSSFLQAPPGWRLREAARLAVDRCAGQCAPR
jgi:hypothetical protein